MNKYQVIKAPIDTEKTNLQKELLNQFSFSVDPGANRVEIKRAVEDIFDVKVKSVKTINVKGKVKTRGRIIGKRKDWKKAHVTLMPGHRINFFDGV
ncbi:MAG: 50S ribosomal protein L23 [Desulfobacteraceae bacterium]|nr:50S ribosomal protein L23 [Desulfobacteraceae bacterium]MBC2756170.1 50S ribosomal protein L23 [Desulfobacteraceae bacterium]